MVIGVIVVTVLVVGVAILARNVTDTGPLSGPFPSSTVSGWDDSSPLPSGPPPPGGGGPEACVPGDPGRRGDHPDDDRVYGGNLSFAEERSYEPAAPENRLSFAHDVTQQVSWMNRRPGWIGQLAVGRLRADDGFTESARATATTAVQCIVTSNMYLPYEPTDREISSEQTSVSGHDAWRIDLEVRVEEQGLPFPGDQVIVVVVEDGDDWGLFFGAVPIGNDRQREILEAAVASLRAS